MGSAADWSKTEYSYDTRNRPVEIKQFDGDTVGSDVSYTYDGVGNILTVTAGGHTTSYTYDRFGNVLTMTDSLGQVETNTYSPLGKPVSTTDRNGNTTAYAYDGLGRLTAVLSMSNGETTILRNTYTKTGQLLSEESNWQRTDYTYDELGRVIRVEDTDLNPPPAVPEPEPEPGPATYTVTLNPNGGTVTPSTVEVTTGGVYQHGG